MNVLAAGFNRLVKPSRGQDPYSCNVGEFCTAPVFFYTVSLSVSIFQSYALPILPAPPDSPSNPQNQAPGWGPKAEKKPDPLSSSPHAFFFSHSNFPFQSYRPGHTNPPKSILVLLSYLYYLPHWSPLLLFLLSEYLLSSLSHHSSPPALSFPHVFVPPMGKVNFCPLSLTPVGIRTVCLQPWLACKASELSALAFPYIPDLPACRRVGFLSPPWPPYRCPPDLTIRNNVVGVGKQCGANSNGQV